MSTAFIDGIQTNQDGQVDLMVNAITSTNHAFTRPRKIILGKSFIQLGYPHIFKTMQLTTEPGQFRTIRNVNNIHQPMSVVDGDYVKLCFIRYWDECSARNHHALPENRMKIAQSTYTGKPYTYPDDALANANSQKIIINECTQHPNDCITSGKHTMSAHLQLSDVSIPLFNVSEQPPQKKRKFNVSGSLVLQMKRIMDNN